uniref:Si:ch211-141e20.2 n=1 Tax=Nothobranchius kadleci TaxID=1051664 RepID=A0A1A8D5J3_NOTKA
MLHLLNLLMLAMASSRHAVSYSAQVTGGSVTVELGVSATLPCKLAGTLAKDETLEQISWQRLTKEKTKLDNFFTITATAIRFINGKDTRFEYAGRFSDHDGTLRLHNVSLKDEGTYTCILTFFPTGNKQTNIPLRVLVPPSTSVMDERPVLGDQDVLLATCTAAGSKPQANVWWDSKALQSSMTQKSTLVSHLNGTSTSVAFLYGRPTKHIYGSLAHCVVSHEALTENTTLPFTIQVYFAPEEVKITQKFPNVIECESTANPNPTFSWSRHESSLPSTVNKHNATLELTGWDPDLNGLYQCEASNDYGAQKTFLYVHLSSVSGGSQAGWILFGLLLALTISAAAFVFFRNHTKSPSFRRREASRDTPLEQNEPIRQSGESS